MYEIKNILVPLDFSPQFQKVLPMLKTLLDKHQPVLYLFHAVRQLDHFINPYVTSPDIAKIVEGRVKDAEEQIVKMSESAFPGAKDIVRKVVNGDPAKKIVNYAEEHNIDLIVMATHGRKGLDHAVFGSVAENVIRKSFIPVLTINPYRV